LKEEVLPRFNFSRAISERSRAACSACATGTDPEPHRDKQQTNDNTMKETYYIGLDVHKETIAIAYTSGSGREDGVYHGQCGGSIPVAVNALRKLATKLGVEFKDLKVCYEAGPTGFVLARRLIRYGLDCVLMSPSKTERKPGDKIKTDSRAERDRLHRSPKGGGGGRHQPRRLQNRQAFPQRRHHRGAHPACPR
jgi:hypothetical protein